MVEPYPSKGSNLRDFLKAYKNNEDEAVKVGYKPGLYYFSGELPPRFKRGEFAGFDNQVKIGAAGLKATRNDKDAEWNASKDSMPRNRLAGRLQMYAGHQGVSNPRLLGVRTMTYGNTVDGKSRNVAESEEQMKQVMTALSRKPENGGHPGIKGGEEHAYTGSMDNRGNFTYAKGNPEWFMVDWDQEHNGVTTHQAIMSAMGHMPKEEFRPKNTTAENQPTQFAVLDNNKHPKLSLIEDAHRKREFQNTRGYAARQESKKQLKIQHQRAIQDLRNLEEQLWKQRNAG